MKVKLLQTYEHQENSKVYLLGEVVNVENNQNSDFYSIWYKNGQLDLLPKKVCQKL